MTLRVIALALVVTLAGAACSAPVPSRSLPGTIRSASRVAPPPGDMAPATTVQRQPRTFAPALARMRRSVHVHPLLSDEEDGDHGCGASLVGADIVLDEQEPAVHVDGVDACEAALQARHRDTVLRLETGGHALWTSAVSITAESATIVGARGHCAGVLDGACRSDFAHLSWVVQSIVGPIVSVDSFDERAGGGGPPCGGNVWRTVDLRTGRAAALDALVTEDSLVAALASSPAIAELLEEADRDALRSARTLEAVLAIPGLRPLTEDSTGYAFADGDPHAAPGTVTMFLGARWTYQGCSHPDIEPVVLQVVARPEAVEWFADAAQGEGLLARVEELQPEP